MRTDTHAIKNATEATARGVLTAHGINEKEANAYAEATSEATVEAIVMSQQDLVTKQDLDVAVAGLRTEMADIRTEMANLRTEVNEDRQREVADGNGERQHEDTGLHDRGNGPLPFPLHLFQSGENSTAAFAGV